MPFRWNAHLPGPIAYSRPMRKRRKGSGPLTTLLVWFIVKPLEWALKGSVAAVKAAKVSSPRNDGSAPYTAIKGHFSPDVPGRWYYTAYGPLYWSGTNWYDPEGRAIF